MTSLVALILQNEREIKLRTRTQYWVKLLVLHGQWPEPYIKQGNKYQIMRKNQLC